MYLVKMRVQIAPRPTWALQKAVASGGSNLARLGELGGNHLPYFAINRGGSEEEKGSAP